MPQTDFCDTQPFNNMRLRSGIKTPSAEEPNKAVMPPSNGGTPTPKPNPTPKSNSKSKSHQSPATAKRDTPTSTHAAERNPSPRKRKVNPVQEESDSGSGSEAGEDESDDELAELEGALSAGEDDDSDSEGTGQDDDESDDELENGDHAQDGDDDDALHSDDIPSEGDDDDEESRKIPPLKPGQVPGLDPDDMNDGGEDLRNYRVETDARRNERYVYDEIDPVYDSDDTDANEPVNTIGDIDLKFYDSYPHIGYDINGKKIMRPAAGEALDALLDSIEVPKGWTGLTDPTTGKPLNLSQDELELIKKIQMKELPQDGFDPYPVSIMLLFDANPTFANR